MKHERIIGADDQVSAAFVRTLILCCLVGAAMWAALIALVV